MGLSGRIFRSSRAAPKSPATSTSMASLTPGMRAVPVRAAARASPLVMLSKPAPRLAWRTVEICLRVSGSRATHLPFQATSGCLRLAIWAKSSTLRASSPSMRDQSALTLPSRPAWTWVAASVDAAGAQAHLGAQALGPAEVGQGLGDVDEEAGLLQLGRAPGQEPPGLRGPEQQVLGPLARQGPLQGREEGHGAGQAAQQHLAGLEHLGFRGGFPELGHADVCARLGLQAHLQDPALLRQPVGLLDGSWLWVGTGGASRLQAGPHPLGPGALAPLVQLLAQGALGDADGGELGQLVGQGHHEALVPGQAVALVAPQPVDEAQARDRRPPAGRRPRSA